MGKYSLSINVFIVLCALAPWSVHSEEEHSKITVREALGEELHDTPVEISGVVLRQTGPDTLLIHDGTAAVEVEVPPEQIPPGGLKANTRIRIRGEITYDEEGSREVEANQLFWTF